MIRVMVEHSPKLFEIIGWYDAPSLTGEAPLPPTIESSGQTFYRVLTKPTYVLYRAAISGWGASKDPSDTRPVFPAAQR